MKQTDLSKLADREIQNRVDESIRVSGALFDEVLVPLARERQRENAQPYFPEWRDQAVRTYFVQPEIRVMTPADFDFPGSGTGAGLVQALGERWSAEGETVLCTAIPHLRSIVELLAGEAVDDDANVDIFCYTLF